MSHRRPQARSAQSRVYNALCIHWDHHPENAAQQYGKGTDIAQIRRYLQCVKPDATQCHAIGCFGYASYPSDIAPVVPGLIGDPLQKWVEACAKEGVAFGCYAASFDCQSPVSVPQWRCVTSSGAISTQHYCANGPWADEFFIPLLHEIIDRYHPAHFWIDGAWLPPKRDSYCFCDHCQARFTQLYSHRMPIDPTPLEWMELQEFHEQSLDNAISHIARSIRQHDPAILLACNTMYFFKDVRKPMPETYTSRAHSDPQGTQGHTQARSSVQGHPQARSVQGQVDWLSWDAINTPNLHRASFESTYISTAGQPADIMIYEQGIVQWKPQLLRRLRTLVQLKTEASTILAHGARVNLWHDPKPDGSIPQTKADIAGKLAAFVRERQSWCIDNSSVAEVVVLASRLDHFVDPQHQDKIVRAMQQLLQEAHIPCDIVHDDGMLNRLVQYHVVILPETTALSLDTAQWLHQYVLDGGCILLIATELTGGDTRWIETLLGDAPGVSIRPTDYFGGEADWDGRVVELGHRRFAVSDNTRCLIPYITGEAQGAPIVPWLSELTSGDGSVLIISGEAASDYADTHWPPLRDLIASAVRKGIGRLPLVEMAGHPGIELVLNRRDGDLYVHLVNLTPGLSFGAPTEVFFDEVPVYRDIALTVRPPQQPSKIILLPEDKDLQRVVETGDGSARFALADGLASLGDCEDPSHSCTLQIIVPELQHHVAICLKGVFDDRNELDYVL